MEDGEAGKAHSRSEEQQGLMTEIPHPHPKHSPAHFLYKTDNCMIMWCIKTGIYKIRTAKRPGIQ